MLGWIFKKPVIAGLTLPEGPKPRAVAATPASVAKPKTTPKAAREPAAAKPVETVDWPALLQAAGSDTAALLALAQGAAPLDTKLAAVAALSGEAALKQAERQIRNHDRRVHRLAKQRLQALVGQRETAALAAGLIESAKALLQEPQIAINRLVDLDRGWQALNAEQVSPAAAIEFHALVQQVADLTRERSEQDLQLKRWLADARQGLAAWLPAAAAVARGEQPPDTLIESRATAQALCATAPAAESATTVTASLAQAIADMDALLERLALLDEVLQGRPQAASAPVAVDAPSDVDAPVGADAPAEVDAPVAEDEAAAPAEPVAPDSPPATPEPALAEPTTIAEATQPEVTATEVAVADPPALEATAPAARVPSPPRLSAAARWQALPPLANSVHAEALGQRFAAWQQAQVHAREDRRLQQRERAKDQQRAQRTERTESLAQLLEQGETALDAGQLADTHRHLIAIDEMLHAGATATALYTRIDALQARYAQLKGWQHWAGGLARDELTQQAEALAAVAGGPVEARTVKLSIKQQAEVIDDMRARWKELDRLGGATSRALWQRFDGALKLAYEPVAAHLAVLRAQREQNLLARQQLIEAMDAVPLPDADGPNSADTAGRWRPLAEALDHFHTEWRKLGPVEHTVPRKAQAALLKRHEGAQQRLWAPLQLARQTAQAAREQLIVRARALAEQAAAGTAGRDTVNHVRELQVQWQQQAKALPLQRATESALWADFKGTIDSIFSARDAAFNARDAEFKSYAAERIKLIERLEALNADTPTADLKRSLAEVEQLWQRCGPAPRNEAAALDARFGRAHGAARQHLTFSAQRRWHGVCDALAAKQALCVEWAGQEGDAAERQARWETLPALPAAWEVALRLRAGLQGQAGVPAAATAVDEWLLHLEAAWETPSPAAFADARRQLKLQAMKSAMEGRRAAVPAPLPPDDLLAALLAQPALPGLQGERLQTLLAALRNRGAIAAR